MNKNINADTCPYCGGSDIIGNQVDVEFESAYQACACEDCEAEWSDCYEMARRTDNEGDTIQSKECVIIGDITDDSITANHYIVRTINSLLRNYPELKPHINTTNETD